MAKGKLKLNDDAREKSARRKSTIQYLGMKQSLPPQNANIAVVTNQEAPLPLSHISTSIEDMSHKYEEWMKIAADNKINSNNSWSVQLIDYFHELRLMKEGDSINFQKASCTLDGCVKVYSTRVDSVATETTRLLSGLSDRDHGTVETESQAHTDSDNENITKKRAKKRISKGSTLESNPHVLNVKNVDQEFAIDPLFKKTCIEFDETGASGLLLNHLSLFDNGRILLEAADGDFDYQNVRLSADDAGLLYLEPQILENLIHDILKIESTSVLLYETHPERPNVSWSDYETYENLDLEHDSVISEDFDQIFNNFEQDMLAKPGNSRDEEPWEVAPHQDFDHSTSLQAPLKQTSVALNTQAGEYSYFEESLVKNWASVHWKVPSFKKSIDLKARLTSGTADIAQKKSKAAKTIFSIDFYDKCGTFSLFDSDKNHITLISQTKLESKTHHLLPFDLHYSLKTFQTLFLKPHQVSRSDHLYVEQVSDDFYEKDVGNEVAGCQDETEGHNACDDAYIAAPRMEALSYSKKAKRVDVKQLKDSIWTALEAKSSVDFNSVLREISPTQSVKDEITAPFYFICILHLANEKNLTLEGDANMANFSIAQ